MRTNYLYVIILLLSTQFGFSQEELTSYLTLPQELTKNANAVVRLYEMNIAINAINDAEISEKRKIFSFIF